MITDLHKAAQAVITARDNYGWSAEADAAINDLRAALAEDHLTAAKSLAWDELDERQREVYLSYAMASPVGHPSPASATVSRVDGDVHQPAPTPAPELRPIPRDLAQRLTAQFGFLPPGLCIETVEGAEGGDRG